MARPQEHSGQTPVPDPEGVSFAEVSTWLAGGSALEEVMRSGSGGWWNRGKRAATARGENLSEWVLPVRVAGGRQGVLLGRGRGPAWGVASSARPLGRCARAHCAPPAGTAGPATRACGEREWSCGPEDVETCEPPARPRPSRGPAGTRRAPRPCPQRSSRPAGTLRALEGARHSAQAPCPSGPHFSPQALWGDAGSHLGAHWRGCLPDAPHSLPSQKHVLRGGALSQRRPLQSLSIPARDDPLVPSRAPLPRETLCPEATAQRLTPPPAPCLP
eukprot:bmy_07565T0